MEIQETASSDVVLRAFIEEILHGFSRQGEFVTMSLGKRIKG
jgi:hypothetical protein